MPEYQHSRLWRTSLGPDSDHHNYEQERDRLRVALDRMRTNVAPMAARIAIDLPDFTVHDETHLDALWALADQIAGDGVSFNPAEGFLFGVAVLLHDLGLAVAAYPGGVDELRGSTDWKDSLATELRSSLGQAPTTAQVDDADEGMKSRADRAVLRERHASRALDLALVAYPADGDNVVYLLEDAGLRAEFAWVAGELAASHWWSVPQLRELADSRLAATSLPAEWEVDILKLACLLRLADVAHLDARRAPPERRRAQRPEPGSDLHWDFQERMARPTVNDARLRFQSTRPFGRDDAAAWWLAEETLRYVDHELREVDSLLRDLGRAKLAVDGVVGADDVRRLAQSVVPDGWEPIDAKLAVSDITGLVQRLGGARLYGRKPMVPVREGIQNGADAARARRALQGITGRVEVGLATAEDRVQVTLTDNGIGMASSTLAGPLLDFGRSLWRDGSLRDFVPGLANTDFEPTGQFGIGFFSVFMFGGPVTVTSRFYLDAQADTHVLEFPDGLTRRALLRKAEGHEQLIEPGTRVCFELDGGDEENPIELVVDPAAVLGRLCPTLDIDLYLTVNGATTRIVEADDWREMPADALLTRVAGPRWTRLAPYVRPVVSQEQEMVGRASAYSGAWRDGPGTVTVGGFATANLLSFAGVLIGDRPNVARSDAEVLVSKPELVTWAEQQAVLWGEGDESEFQKISVAAFLGYVGADIGNMPICYGEEGAFNRTELAAWLEGRDRFFLWEEIDGAEVAAAGPGFDPQFEPGPDTLLIEAQIGIRGPVGREDPDQPVTPISLASVIAAVVADTWSADGHWVRCRETTGEIIGTANGDDVASWTATVYELVADAPTPAAPDDDAAPAT